MTSHIETLLLLALPASGKSEIRRYLSHVPETECRRSFHLQPTVQLDDFPYVHFMRRIDEELDSTATPRVFFRAGDKPFRRGEEWGTLIHLINEDYADLRWRQPYAPRSASLLLFDRIDRAAEKAGLTPRLQQLPPATRAAVADRLEASARELLGQKLAGYPEKTDESERTVVIEFARGGAQGAHLPLAPPYGYQYALGQLHSSILERAAILYVWVTPEQSRQKNNERTNPNDPGSILHHGVPLEVMLQEYGCDDIDWLMQHSAAQGTVTVQANGSRINVPIARLDNRDDLTSFLRGDPSSWPKPKVEALHAALTDAFAHLHSRHTR